uniref:Uncharacterized protein n=1 Tax=Glossina brevipalpis TaxID=37001 RepID=A0A1A9WLN9_9MUSC
MIGNPSKDYLSYAVNFGVAYNLPTADWARRHHEGFANTTKVLRQRRSRYDFYEKLILILDNMGFNGVSCVARALCESAKIFGNSERKRGGMIEEIVKTIFSYPSIQAVENEPKEHRYYDHIYGRAKRDNIACSTQYKECHISLLDLALGKYLTSIGQEHNDFKFM